MNERGTRTLTEAISSAISADILETRTITPGRVESVSGERAVVLPLLKRKTVAGVVIEPKPIPNVPVLSLRAGGFAITFPVTQGDVGLLLCSDRSLDLWLEQGGQVDPQSGRHHSMTDAVFLPGLHHWGDSIATQSSTDLVIAKEDGAALVQISGGLVEVGTHPASSFVALASLVDARLNALASVLSAWVPVPADGGGALKTALTTLLGSGWPGPTVGATKVKAS